MLQSSHQQQWQTAVNIMLVKNILVRKTNTAKEIIELEALDLKVTDPFPSGLSGFPVTDILGK